MSWNTPTTTQGSYQATDPNTVNHTCAANTRVLVVVLFVNGITTRTGGAPTYNSLPLTDSGAGFVYLSGSGECGVEIWYRLNPPTGSSYTVSVPNTNTVPFDISVMSFTATANSAAKDSYNSSTGDSTTPSTNVVTNTNNCLMIGGLGSGDRDYATKGANYTFVHQYDAGNQVWMSEYDLDAGTAGSTAVNFTTPHSEDWGVIGIAFKEITATNTNDSTTTFLKGNDNTLDNQPAFLKGSTDTLDSTPAYLFSAVTITDNQPAFLAGLDTILDNQPAYLFSSVDDLDSTPAYLASSLPTSSAQSAYLKGPTLSSTPAWVEGTDPAITDIYGGKGRLRFAKLDSSYARVLAKLDYEDRPNLGVKMSYQFNSNVGTGEFRIWLRSSNDWYAFERPTTGYELTLLNDSSTVKFHRVNGGTRTEIDSWTESAPDTGVHWIKFQISDDNVRVKLWADGAGEPADWNRVKVDATIPDAGGLQMGYFRVDGAQKELYIDSLSTFVTDEVNISAFMVGGLASSTPAFLQGPSGTPASDSQSAYLAGSSTATDSQYAYSIGQDAASDTQPAYMVGGIEVSDATSSYTVGQDTALDVTPAFLLGSINVADSTPSYTEGIDSATDNQPVFLVGSIDITDAQTAYSHGSLLTNDAQSAYIAGQIVANVNKSVYLAGKDTLTDNTPAYAHGSIEATDTQSAFAEGEGAAFPVSDSTPAYLGGQDEATDSTSAYLSGQSTLTDAQVSYAHGQDSALDNQSVFLTGSLSDTSGQASYLIGQDTATDSQPVFLAGSIDTTTQQDSYLAGQDTALDAQTAWLTGGIVIIDSTDGYLHGQNYGTNSSSAYLLGSLNITDNQASYTAGQDTSLNSQVSYLKGQDTGTDSSPAHLTGQSTAQSSSSAFAKADDYEPLIPDGNITIGSWKNESEGSSLWSSIDEYPYSDSDYVYYDGAAGSESFEVSLSDPNGDPLPDGIHTISWRAGQIAGTGTIVMKVELMQGAVLICTDQQTITDSFQTFEHTLTQDEINDITDYTDLRLRFTVVSVT